MATKFFTIVFAIFLIALTRETSATFGKILEKIGSKGEVGGSVEVSQSGQVLVPANGASSSSGHSSSILGLGLGSHLSEKSKGQAIYYQPAPAVPVYQPSVQPVYPAPPAPVYPAPPAPVYPAPVAPVYPAPATPVYPAPSSPVYPVPAQPIYPPPPPPQPAPPQIEWVCRNYKTHDVYNFPRQSPCFQGYCQAEKFDPINLPY